MANEGDDTGAGGGSASGVQKPAEWSRAVARPAVRSPSFMRQLAASCLTELLFLTAACGSVAPAGASPFLPATRSATSSAARGSARAAQAAPALISFRATYGGPLAVYDPIWIAMDDGAFRRHGVDFHLSVANTAAGLSALIGGYSDAIIVSAPGLINADAAGAHLLMVGSIFQRPVFSLFAQKGITSPQQLKGKPFGSGQPGSPLEYGATLALQEVGLRSSDVQILRFNNSATLTKAFVAGRLTAVIAQPPNNFLLEADGYPQLAGPPKVPFQAIGVVVNSAALPRLRPVIPRVLAALRSGMERYVSDETYSVAEMSKYMKNQSDTVLRQSYVFYKQLQNGFTPAMLVSRQGLAATAEYIATHNPKVHSVDVSSFYDNSYARALDASVAGRAAGNSGGS